MHTYDWLIDRLERKVRQELDQELGRMFAGDKKALKKIDKHFHKHRGLNKRAFC